MGVRKESAMGTAATYPPAMQLRLNGKLLADPGGCPAWLSAFLAEDEVLGHFHSPPFRLCKSCQHDIE